MDGKLRDEKSFRALIEALEKTAKAHANPAEQFAKTEAKLLPVRGNEEPGDHIGPTKGDHSAFAEECDPTRLEFDRNLCIQEYVKTQFAGVPVPVERVDLLRELQPFFHDFRVEDEGEYWGLGMQTF